MSKKFLVDIDLGGNRIISAVVNPLSKDPSTGSAGMIYYNTTDHHFKIHNGTSWANVGDAVTLSDIAEDDPGSHKYKLTNGSTYDATTGYKFTLRSIQLINSDDTRGHINLTNADGILQITSNMKFLAPTGDNIVVPRAVGGINAGTKASDLKKMSLDEVIDSILFPVIEPTMNPGPSVTFTWPSDYSDNMIVYVGNAAPVEGFNHSYSTGKWHVDGQADVNYGGSETASSYLVNDADVSTVTAFNADSDNKITTSQYGYKVKVTYGKGGTPVNSKGVSYPTDSKCPQAVENGTVSSSVHYIYVTYPFYTNGESASSSNGDTSFPSSAKNTADTELPKTKWAASMVIGVKFASEAYTGQRILFEYPSVKKVSKVEFYNTVSGKWEVMDISTFTESEATNRNINSKSYPYKRLTSNGSLMGGIQLRFTLTDRA